MNSKLIFTAILLFLTTTLPAQDIPRDSILNVCDVCSKRSLGTNSGLFFVKKNSSPKEKDLFKVKECFTCNALPLEYKYALANRIAASYMYQNESKDSVIKYMNLARSYSPMLFCEDNYRQDYWIEDIDKEFFKDFKPMYIRLLSEEIWKKEIKRCNICCPEAIAEATKDEKKEKETPTNQIYYNALLKISNNDQKHRENMNEPFFQELQKELDAQNRVKLDSLYEMYGMPTKEMVTSSGVGTLLFIMLHSTDCDWTKKWIIRCLDAYVQKINSFRSVEIVINRFFYTGDNNVYGYKETICEDSELFLEKLRSRYSKIIAQNFGFSN
ncbi:MAG: hypothetical protein ACPG19_04240 [Saprospiraceae bacterium]